MKTKPNDIRRARGFTLIEMLVGMVIIAVLTTIVFASSRGVMQSARQSASMSTLRQVGSLAMTWSAENNGRIPDEGGEGVQRFTDLARPVNANAWYNVLPPMIGMKSASEYRSRPAEFYTEDSLFFLKSAKYPANTGASAYFAFAINSQLQAGMKEPVRLTRLENPARTALFAEARLPDELDLQPQGGGVSGTDLGQPKVRDRRFVARYGNTGIIVFADGHAEAVNASNVFDTNHVLWALPQ